MPLIARERVKIVGGKFVFLRSKLWDGDVTYVGVLCCPCGIRIKCGARFVNLGTVFVLSSPC
jgi:hypothetical protein